MLEFLEHEDRYEQRPLDESRIADVGNAAIDDDARIKQLVGLVLLRCHCRSACRRLRSARAHLLHLCELLHEARHEVKEPRELLALLDCDGDAEITEDDAEDDGDVISDNRDLRK